jgi:hypothetical protein
MENEGMLLSELIVVEQYVSPVFLPAATCIGSEDQSVVFWLAWSASLK